MSAIQVGRLLDFNQYENNMLARYNQYPQEIVREIAQSIICYTDINDQELIYPLFTNSLIATNIGAVGFDMLNFFSDNKLYQFIYSKLEDTLTSQRVYERDEDKAAYKKQFIEKNVYDELKYVLTRIYERDEDKAAYIKQFIEKNVYDYNVIDYVKSMYQE